jgi:UDP-N-acetylmuramyl pentapeptide phosphotransferase/UDP-N-acetylglucosamine-1-phosphate transferase
MLAPALLALVTAIGGGWLYLRFTPARALDIPNARSSHTHPTPRGGGVVIVGGFLVGLLAWLATGGSLSPRALGWLVGALLIAGVGFADDLRSLPVVPRLLAQLLAAILLTVAAVQQPFSLAVPLAFVYIIVETNVFNFMDGIDGLATAQAVIAALAIAIAGVILVNPLLEATGALIAAASVGFFVWNRPPARCFMGDVGSTFLGFSFAGLCLLGNIGVGASGGRLPLEFDLVLLAPFLFDALVTLGRRVLKGERWYAPHRSHFYQRLVLCGASHAQVTGLYAGLAIIAGAAAIVGIAVGPTTRQLLTVLAYVPMLGVVGLVWRLEAKRHSPAAEQPKETPTVVTQGHS